MTLTDFGRFAPNLAKLWPTLGQVRRGLARVGQIWASFVRWWPANSRLPGHLGATRAAPPRPRTRHPVDTDSAQVSCYADGVRHRVEHVGHCRWPRKGPMSLHQSLSVCLQRPNLLLEARRGLHTKCSGFWGLGFLWGLPSARSRKQLGVVNTPPALVSHVIPFLSPLQ